jgi:glucose-6-phosphate 1-dehydrogenase
MTPPSEIRTYTKEELCLLEVTPDPCGIIVFGASGDLTHRKLLPSLHFLASQGLMPKDFYILGVSRTKMTDEQFRENVKVAVSDPSIPVEKTRAFLERCFYFSGEYVKAELYASLITTIGALDKKFSINQRHIFYLSTPPSLYSPIIAHLGRSGLAHREVDNDDTWARVIIE